MSLSFYKEPPGVGSGYKTPVVTDLDEMCRLLTEILSELRQLREVVHLQTEWLRLHLPDNLRNQ